MVGAGCASRADDPTPESRRAFYYWRTALQLTATEADALARLKVSRLYLRFFDVEASEPGASLHPVAEVALAPGARLPAGVELVPVVFLREAALRGLPPGRPEVLAREVLAAVDRRATVLGTSYREVQLDCDWADGTRDAWFTFLRAATALAHTRQLKVSATVRLHQVKYRERTGVPPVDRGMLMAYNMGRLSAEPDERSIFDERSAAKYLARLPEYPLPLDVALPVFSWTVLTRGEHVEDLLQSTDPAELEAVPFLERLAPGRFRATRTAFLHGTLLRQGDVLKAEVIGPADARAAADQLAPRLPSLSIGGPPRTITLFDLSERTLARHDLESLDNLFRRLR